VTKFEGNQFSNLNGAPTQVADWKERPWCVFVSCWCTLSLSEWAIWAGGRTILWVSNSTLGYLHSLQRPPPPFTNLWVSNTTLDHLHSLHPPPLLLRASPSANKAPWPAIMQ